MSRGTVEVEQVRSWLDSWAPQATAEEWDNVGTLVDCGRPVSRLLVCLDITREVIEEAVGQGCQLIVAHHPVIFHPLRGLKGGQPAFQLVQRGVSAICMHTNLDAAQGGVNDQLAAVLGLQQPAPLGGLGRVGALPGPLAPAELAALCARRLATPVRFADGGRPVNRVAVVGGAGGDFIPAALQAGAQALVTGEAGHHDALEAAAQGLTLVAAGHFATEAPVLQPLARGLQEQFPGLGVAVSRRGCDPFCFCTGEG